MATRIINVLFAQELAFEVVQMVSVFPLDESVSQRWEAPAWLRK